MTKTPLSAFNANHALIRKTIRKYQAVFCLAVVTLLALIAYGYNRQHSSEKNSSRSISAKMPAFRPADVKKIVVGTELDHQTITIFFQDGLWRVAERGNAQADTSFIASFLEDLSNIKPLKEIDYIPESDTLQSLNLLDKQVTKDGKNVNIPGIKLTLYDESNQILLDMTLGMGHIRPGSDPVEYSQIDGRYVLVKNAEGTDHPPVFLIGDSLQNCIPS